MKVQKALLFDIGNTRVKWGVLDDGELRRTGSIGHATLKQKGIESLTKRLPRRVEKLIASNVAGPDFATRFARAIGIHTGGDLRYVHSERSACGVTNGYRRPRSLGVDRWMAMIGARAGSKSALLVVDAGTALTIDAIDRSGQHLGGQIIPGTGLLANVLGSDTSDIGPPATRRVPDPEPWHDMFGDATGAAVAWGSLNAVCGAIERALRALRSAGHRPKIVLTGGDASRILSQLGSTAAHRPHLVLEGLAFVMQRDS